MGRTVRSDSSNKPNVKPVDKISLSEKNVVLRLIGVVVLLVIAAFAFAYAINGWLSTESGWTTIEADSASEINCSNDFVFSYHLGSGDTSATVENKALRIIYTDATEKAYQLFHNKEKFDAVNNIYYINQHPNEVIEVDTALYDAFSVIQEYENRSIYMAPIYAQYDIFYCNDDSELVNYDPYLNEQVAADYQEIALFANNPEAIDIQLLEDNKIMLYVSDEYLAYAEENYITDYIDFFWMKNAFIADYIASVLIENGYTAGSISSFDGFVRNLDTTDVTYSFNIFDKQEDNVYVAAAMQYTGAHSIVFLRNYMMNSYDEQYYYQLSNGDVRTSYVDIADGYCKSAVNNLVSYSADLGCAEVLMQMMPIYIADTFDAQALLSLMENGIHSIYCENGVIYYNEKSLVLTELYQKEDVQYQTSFVEK